jgi:hypothetical protein
MANCGPHLYSVIFWDGSMILNDAINARAAAEDSNMTPLSMADKVSLKASQEMEIGIQGAANLSIARGGQK